jgi:CheY-like chemotaxis protein
MKATRVLLVEDNPIMCKFVCSALEAQDMRVTEAHGGEEALDLWAAEPSDLVLQDLRLPDMDGFDLVSRIRALPGGAEVPILALSGLLSGMEEARISSIGFSDIIMKPVEAFRLRQVVRAHLPRAQPAGTRFGHGRRVLIVDDDVIQSKLVGFRLSRLGFETSSATNGVEALRLVRISRPDVIVSDIMMPELDGFGLCAAIREDPALSGIPVVLMTNSYVDEADRELARAAGADQFVIRTPTMVEVVDAVHLSLARPTPRVSAPNNAVKLEKVWASRIMSQLDRQVTINAGMARRCSMLSAQLAILSGISDALSGSCDIQEALTAVLGACVDAGEFALGALHLTRSIPEQVLKFGQWEGWSEGDTQAVLQQSERCLKAIHGQALLVSTPASLRGLSPVFERTKVSGAVIVPVTHGSVCFGTLLMASKANALHQQDRLAFLEGVATQIAQALTLTRAFADKDASEKKATAQATVLRSVLETVAEGVVVTDAAGEFLLWNRAAEAILGTGSAHVPARDWPRQFGLLFSDSMLPVPAAEAPLVRALAGHVVDGIAPFFMGEDTAAHGRYVTISARPLEEGTGVVGAVAVLRDVTDEKSTHTQLLVADRLASLGMLAAGVAHEINNPLAAVMGNLELATDTLAALAPGEDASADLVEVSGMLRDASEAAGRVQRIVRDLRVFSRADPETSATVNIHDVLESVLRMASNEIRHCATLVRDYTDVPLVEGNESRLSQVFLNLVMNAVQALGERQAADNQIRISTRSDALGRVVISVADTGEGIGPESMKRLFVPFFTTKRVGMGTGLGLSICHRLVTAAGGEITVESQPGEGSTFRVALRPALGSDQAPLMPVAQTVKPPAPRRGRILLIDDDEAILSVLRRSLAQDHECVAARSASEALTRLAAGERFDVIFCDLMMPGMSGMDLYTELKRLAPADVHKLVFLTGGAFTPKLQEFLLAVPNERIEKPFDVSKLKASVTARLL